MDDLYDEVDKLGRNLEGLLDKVESNKILSRADDGAIDLGPWVVNTNQVIESLVAHVGRLTIVAAELARREIERG